MKFPSVYIIILNWKGLEDTLSLLDSLSLLNYPEFGICIIENGSADNSVRCISSWLQSSNFPFEQMDAENYSVSNSSVKTKVQFLISNKNLGFAKGSNLGIALAERLKYDLVLLLNNDTIVEPNFLNKLILQKINHPEYVALTPQIRYFDPSDIIWNCGGELIFWGFWKKYYFEKAHINQIDEADELKDISFVTGCALLFEYKKLGKLTEDFFFGEEDFEFSLRLKQNKQKMGCVMNSIIYHKVGASLNNKGVNIGKQYIHLLNRAINTRKNNNNKLLWPLFLIILIIYTLTRLLKNKELNILASLRFSTSLFKDSISLDKVSQQKFTQTLDKKEW